MMSPLSSAPLKSERNTKALVPRARARIPLWAVEVLASWALSTARLTRGTMAPKIATHCPLTHSRRTTWVSLIRRSPRALANQPPGSGRASVCRRRASVRVGGKRVRNQGGLPRIGEVSIPSSGPGIQVRHRGCS